MVSICILCYLDMRFCSFSMDRSRVHISDKPSLFVYLQNHRRYTGPHSEGVVCVFYHTVRLSNGITIGELDPARAMGKARHHQFLAFMDVVGKGKRKVDDMPMFTENGILYFLFVLYRACALFMYVTFPLRFLYADSHAVDRCVGDSSLAAYIPGILSHFHFSRVTMSVVSVTN